MTGIEFFEKGGFVVLDEDFDRCDPAGMVRPDASLVALAQIDCALAEFSRRELVSAAQVADLLLDIRSALSVCEGS